MTGASEYQDPSQEILPTPDAPANASCCLPEAIRPRLVLKGMPPVVPPVLGAVDAVSGDAEREGEADGDVGVSALAAAALLEAGAGEGDGEGEGEDGGDEAGVVSSPSDPEAGFSSVSGALVEPVLDSSGLALGDDVGTDVVLETVMVWVDFEVIVTVPPAHLSPEVPWLSLSATACLSPAGGGISGDVSSGCSAVP